MARMPVAIAAAFCFLALLALNINVTSVERPATPTPLPELQTGDVVLRHGHGLWSELFARLNRRDSRFSHAGIVVNDDSHWYVIHAEADNLGRNGTVRRDEWAVFSDQARHLAILRLDDSIAAARVAEAASSMHGDALPFDFSFDLTRVEAVYCSELVWRALSHGLQHDPLPDKPRVQGRDAVLVENLLLDMADLGLVYRSDL